MQAAVCYRFAAPLVIEDLSLAPPGPGEVEVEVKACAICHSDILFIDGAWGGELPAVYGHEAAGRVTALGAGVEGLNPGDHVVVTMLRACGGCFFCTQGERHNCETEFPLDRRGPLRDARGETVKQALRTGAFAERVVVHGSQVAAIPGQVPFASAALLACGVITGLGAVVNTARVRPGSSVVVIGTGGVGLNSVQGAVLCGAGKIIALDLADDKLVAAREFGATHTVNAGRDDPRQAVLDLTQGRGADTVLVAAGSVRAIEQGLTLLRRGGTLVLVGLTASGVTAALNALDVADASQRILGSKLGMARLPGDVQKLADLYLQGRLKLDELVSARFPLARINDAVDAARRGEGLRNVVVFD